MWLLILSFLSCVCSGLEEHKAVPDKDHDAFFHYKTRRDIEAPKWNIEIIDEEALQPDSYWFISPYMKLDQDEYPMWNGPHIYRTNGELVWSGASTTNYENVQDFRMTYMEGGKKMLSLIWPQNEEGNGWIFNHRYTRHKVMDIRGDNPKPNMHDLNIIDEGKHALILMAPNYTASPIHEPEWDGNCKAGWEGFKEIDVNTNEVLFDWRGRDHIGLNETTFFRNGEEVSLKESCREKWDITHMNSIDKFEDGDYLLSVRHANTLYKISHKDGSIVWRLGGEMNDFHYKDESAIFTRQHHSRIRGENSTHILISVFDNAAGRRGEFEDSSADKSSGLLLALRTDVTPMTVETIVRYGKPLYDTEFDGENKILRSRGSMQFLPNGNVFMGWVSSSHVSEHAPDGRMLMQAMLAKRGASTYRAYKMPWVGWPMQPPDVVSEVGISQQRIRTVVHVSWNGATEVHTWNVLHTSANGEIAELAASELCNGKFETRISATGYLKHVILVALDMDGREIGRSDITTSSSPGHLDPADLDGLEAHWLETHAGFTWEAKQPSSRGSFTTIVSLGALACISYAAVAHRRRIFRYFHIQRNTYWRLANSESVAFPETAEHPNKRMAEH